MDLRNYFFSGWIQVKTRFWLSKCILFTSQPVITFQSSFLCSVAFLNRFNYLSVLCLCESKKRKPFFKSLFIHRLVYLSDTIYSMLFEMFNSNIIEFSTYGYDQCMYLYGMFICIVFWKRATRRRCLLAPFVLFTLIQLKNVFLYINFKFPKNIITLKMLIFF